MDRRASSTLSPRPSRSSSRCRGPPSTGPRIAMELLAAILKLSTSISRQETNPLREGLVFRRPVAGTSDTPDSLQMAALEMNESALERMGEWEEQKYELSAEMDALKTWRYDMIKRSFDHGFTGDGRLTPIIVTSLLGIGETMLNMLDPACLTETPRALDNLNLADCFETLQQTVEEARQLAMESEDSLQISNNPAENTRSKAQATANENQDVLAALRGDINRLQSLMKIIVGLNSLGKPPQNIR